MTRAISTPEDHEIPLKNPEDFCSTCGFALGDHDAEVPEDWFLDPASVPCDSFARGDG